MIQKGSILIFGGLPLILAGVVLIKVTGLSIWWALIALGALMATAGGIQNALLTGHGNK
jgi:hypothetical protein